MSYKCNVGGQVVNFDEEELRIYSSEKDFRLGMPKGARTMTIENLLWESSSINVSPDEKGRYMVFIYENGEIYYLDASTLAFTLKYEDGRAKWSSGRKCYKTEKELQRWNDVTIKEEDGSTRIKRSIAGLVSIKQEQEEAVKALTEAIERVKEAGVKIMSDYCTYDVYAIDVRGISKFQSLYEGDTYSEKEEIIDTNMMRKIASFEVFDSDCCKHTALPFAEKQDGDNDNE